MVNFVNKLELSDKKFQTNGNVRYGNNNGKFIFPIKYFLSFVTDIQSMYFMSDILLKHKFYGFRVP